MTNQPSDQHERLLYEKVKELREKGWKVVPIKSSLPDAIAISPEGDVIAVEVLGRQKRTPRPLPRPGKGRNRGYRYSPRSPLVTAKQYACYDDVLFVFFKYNEEGSWESMASERYPVVHQQQREEWTKWERERMEELGTE